ncbi:S1/P1 nuclease [Thalassotalea mangrovi]|uniref:S1/P1 nuclease n=1 Tax=Thalassotalea mangrovi TaxID=2572245 RepID=UPI00145EC79A|nr:S1/P1 nuclease [Thalassotalea mangrovi]
MSLFVVGYLLIPSAQALGQQGHRIVCQLVFDNLSDTQQRTLNDLVTLIPRQQQAQINQRLHRKNNHPLTFSDSCIWADVIRDLSSYQRYSNWHFINVDRQKSRLTQIECLSGCITRAMLIHHKLWTNSKNSSDKLSALLFISHWFADIHQPLHVSFASDRGGNDIRVTDAQGRCQNLHQVWDSCLVRDLGLNQRQWQQAFIQLQRENAMAWHPEMQQNILMFANESLQITRTPSLGYCKLQPNQACIEHDQIVVYDRHYKAQHLPIIKQRILLSALRLKAYLNATLG